MYCCHGRRHGVNFSRQSVITRVVIKLLITWRHPLKTTTLLSRDVREPDFCMCNNKAADQLHNSLLFLNLKFQDPKNLLWLHGPVCVEPGGKSRIPVFSQRGSMIKTIMHGDKVHWFLYRAKCCFNPGHSWHRFMDEQIRGGGNVEKNWRKRSKLSLFLAHLSRQAYMVSL